MPPPPDLGGKKKLSPKNKKILAGAGLVAAGILGYMYYKNRSASSAAATTDTSSTDPNAIDPNTGIPYADETDYSGVGTSPGLDGVYDPTTGQYIGTGVGTALGGITTVSTNAAWAQASEAYLTNLGYDPATTAAALGAYLLGVPLTSDQYAIVQAAIGFEGTPPNGAPAVQMSNGGGSGNSQGGTGNTGGTSTGGGGTQGGGNTGGGTTGGGTTGGGTGSGQGNPPGTTYGGGGGPKTNTIPNVLGWTGTAAKARMVTAGFKPRQSPTVTPKGKMTKVTSTNPPSGTKAPAGSTVTVNLTVR